MLRAMRRYRFGLLHGTDLLVPQSCAGCGTWLTGAQGALCEACRAEIDTTQRLPYCPRCGRSANPLSIRERDCALCAQERHWNVSRIIRIGDYCPSLRTMITKLKFGGEERQAPLLAALLAERVRASGLLPEIDALVPIPMHLLRRVQRPCDHSAMLAEEMSMLLKAPVKRLVRRIRYASSQTFAQSHHERFANVKGSFAMSRFRSAKGLRVCIVDNVLVSGATLHEVAVALRRGGARAIYAAIVSRAAGAGDFQAGTDALERHAVAVSGAGITGASPRAH